MNVCCALVHLRPPATGLDPERSEGEIGEARFQLIVDVERLGIHDLGLGTGQHALDIAASVSQVRRGPLVERLDVLSRVGVQLLGGGLFGLREQQAEQLDGVLQLALARRIAVAGWARGVRGERGAA
ncbi:hypothetical protein D1872_301760 [compost metagenome]